MSRTFKVILGVIWFIAFIGELFLAIFNYADGDTLEAIYHMLFTIFLLFCIKE